MAEQSTTMDVDRSRKRKASELANQSDLLTLPTFELDPFNLLTDEEKKERSRVTNEAIASANKAYEHALRVHAKFAYAEARISKHNSDRAELEDFKRTNGLLYQKRRALNLKRCEHLEKIETDKRIDPSDKQEDESKYSGIGSWIDLVHYFDGLTDRVTFENDHLLALHNAAIKKSDEKKQSMKHQTQLLLDASISIDENLEPFLDPVGKINVALLCVFCKCYVLVDDRVVPACQLSSLKIAADQARNGNEVSQTAIPLAHRRCTVYHLRNRKLTTCWACRSPQCLLVSHAAYLQTPQAHLEYSSDEMHTLFSTPTDNQSSSSSHS